MTVLERLLASGAAEDEAQRAASVIGGVLPVDLALAGHVTDEVLAAARRGDVSLVATLLAEEDDATPDEVVALEKFDREDDGVRISRDDFAARFGLT